MKGDLDCSLSSESDMMDDMVDMVDARLKPLSFSARRSLIFRDASSLYGDISHTLKAGYITSTSCFIHCCLADAFHSSTFCSSEQDNLLPLVCLPVCLSDYGQLCCAAHC